MTEFHQMIDPGSRWRPVFKQPLTREYSLSWQQGDFLKSTFRRLYFVSFILIVAFFFSYLAAYFLHDFSVLKYMPSAPKRVPSGGQRNPNVPRLYILPGALYGALETSGSVRIQIF
jgi:hypothetical protein